MNKEILLTRNIHEVINEIKDQYNNINILEMSNMSLINYGSDIQCLGRIGMILLCIDNISFNEALNTAEVKEIIRMLKEMRYSFV
jgi:hypothetical protein